MEQKKLRIVEIIAVWAVFFFAFIGIICIGVGVLSNEAIYCIAGIFCFLLSGLSGWFVAYMNGETSVNVRMVLLIAFLLLCIELLIKMPKAKAGPVSDLVTQSQNLHAQASLLVSDPQLPQLYPAWQAQFNSLSAAIQAELPLANDGEYQASVVGGLNAQNGYGNGNCQSNGFGGFGGNNNGCNMNLQLQTGYYVLLYYQQVLYGDQAMLQQVISNAAQTPTTP
jgi:hypothetical protein